MKKRIGVQGFLMFVAALVTVLFFKYLLPKRQDSSLKILLDTLGILLVAFGFLLRIASRGYKSEHSKNSQNLVGEGPYTLMRNPMYLGTFLIGIGVSLVIFSWWVGLIFGFVFLLVYIPQIKKEEAILLKRFGDEYKRYCQITPRFFPNPIIFFKKGLRNYIFFKRPWIGREFPSLIGVIVLIIGIEIWQGFRPWKLLLIIFCFLIIALLFYEKENAPKKA
jgi:protein-S-isoprenylcysteine O-methyltransferase Ste14